MERVSLKHILIPFVFIASCCQVLSQSPGGVSSNLKIWLKADAGVTTGTGGVSSWADQSGTGNNATQSTSGNRPDFVSNAINFDPGIDFVEANKDFLQITDNSSVEPATFSIFSVFAPDATGQFDAIIAKHADSYSGTGYGLQYFPDGNSVKIIAGPDGSYPNFAARSATVAVTGTPQMIGGIYSGSQLIAFTNNASATFTYSTAITNNSSPVTIGSDHNNTSAMDNIDGDIAELIFYSGTLTATDKNKVESYLATKYGLTLTHNYLNSGGTTVWDVTANATYSNDIAGIGRDDGSGLVQKQSKSVNTDAIVTMGLGTIATTNALNGNSFSANNSYMLWGNNNGDKLVFNQSYNGGANNGLARIWKISESGTVGNVKLRVLKTDLPGATDLLISGSSSFPGGITSVTALSDDGTYYHATVNFSNGDYFTFAGTNTGSLSVTPGLWLKANAGTSSTTDGVAISSWNDQSGDGNTASQGTAGSRPVYRNSSTNNINYNPLVDFDGGDDYMQGSAGAYTRGYYLVLQNDDQIDRDLSGGSDGQMPFGWSCTSCANDFGGFGLGGMTGAFSNEVLTHLVGNSGEWRSAYDDAAASYTSGSVSLFCAKDNAGATGTDIFRNGTELDNATAGSLINVSNAAYSIGRTRTTNFYGLTMYYDGKIAEVISYSARPSNTDHIKIQSYLAIKYGINLSQNYVNSAYTELWNVTTNASYNNNKAGIGRDDYFSFNQKQSVSTNSGIVTFGLGSVAATNIDNGNTFGSDQSFMLWGNNGGSVASLSQDYNGNSGNGVARIWKIEETGSVGSVELKVAKASLVTGVLYLLVSTDPSFPAGSTTEITLSDDGTYFTTTRDFSDGEYFTFGGLSSGSLSATPTLWLKATVGTSSTTNGAAISSWNDQSGNGNNASQATGGLQPIYRNSATDNINYNPLVDFDGGDDYMAGTAGAYSYGYYMVIQNDDQIDRNLSGGSDGQMPYSWDCSGCGSNFAGFGFGGMTGAFSNEVLTHLIGSSAEWRSTYEHASNSFASGSISLFSVRNNSGGTGTDIYRNGVELDNNTVGSLINVSNSAYSLGRARPGNAFALTMYFDGKIAEVVSFSSRPTNTDHAKMESYFAIKYGINLNNNYVSSANTELWNVTTNASYGSNKAGIGRDDYVSLNQKQSVCTSGGIVTFGLGSVASVNSANANTFSVDQSYMIWGNNGGSVASLSQNYNGGSSNGVARIWKVEETGTVGNVQIKVAKANLVSGVNVLFVSTDPSFPNGSTTEVSLSDDGTYFTATLDVADEEYFTFGYTVTPSTSVSPALWIRADAGTSSTSDGAALSSWNDQSGNANNASQGTGVAQPIFKSNATDNFNFNPVVDFDGADQYMAGTAGANTYGYYMVLSDDQVIDKNLGGSNGHMPFGIECSACGTDFAGFGLGGVTSAFTNEVVSHMVGSSVQWRSAHTSDATSYAAGSISMYAVRNNSGGTGSDIYRDGTEIDNNSSGSIINISNEAYALGCAEPGNAYGLVLPFDGKIAELLSYSSRPTDADHQKIQSYLGIKYGIELSTDYYSANGSLVWDRTANTGFNNDIAGIGREDFFNLNQKQSISNSSDAMVAIGLGSIAADNASNANSFSSDEEYLLWGNNNGNLYSDGETDIGTTLNAEIIATRLGRIWKVQEKGDVGSVHLKFDMSAIPGVGGVDGANDLSDVRLLVDADGTFAFNATSIVPTSFNNSTDIVEFDHEFISGTGYYFTLGSVDEANSPLPVTLVSFIAEIANDVVDLHWITASEINNYYFEIERSTDASTWNSITKVPGSGTTMVPKEYSAKDKDPYVGINYYRLKQVDYDGLYKYSDIIAVNYDLSGFAVNIFPNPAVNSIRVLSLVNLEYAEVYLINPYGQLTPLEFYSINKNEIEVDVFNISTGVYYLKMVNFGKSVIQKIIIAK